MDGVQLLLEKGCVPLRQPHRWSVRSLPSSPPEPAASQPAEKEQGNDSPMKSGEQELRDLARVHGSALTPCCAMLPDQGFRSNAWVPDLLWKLQLPPVCLPPFPKQGHLSPHFLLGHENTLPPIQQRIWDQTSLAAQSPHTSSQFKKLQPAWDFGVHVGSTCWASCFSPGFRKVRTAVYWISKHTDHTALLAH